MCKIFLVDDEESIRLVFKSALEMFNFEVISASTLAEARRDFSPSEHKILITDLTLPDGSGESLISEVRALNAGTSIIAITGNYDGEERALSAGADAVLLKPFSIKELISTVKSKCNC